MTRDDVIRLMLEADPEMIINIKDHEEGMEGFTGEDPKLLQFWPFKNYVKFATLVAAAAKGEWVGLTDEEFNDCFVKGDPCENLAEPEAWAVMKEVEAKLKEKNSVQIVGVPPAPTL